MTKAQAMALVKKKHGRLAAIRHNRRGGTAETRESAKAAFNSIPRPDKNDRAAIAAWRKATLPFVGQMHSYRYEVGHIVETPFGNGFGIEGSGDSWEEACHKAGLIK